MRKQDTISWMRTANNVPGQNSTSLLDSRCILSFNDLIIVYAIRCYCPSMLLIMTHSGDEI
jgi:hypothetical protein